VHATLEHLGIRATDAELNALNIYFEGHYRATVDEGPIVIATLGSDAVDHDKIKDWAAKVDARAPELIALGLFGPASSGGNARFGWLVGETLRGIREAALEGRKALDDMDATGASAGADPELRGAFEEAIDETLTLVDRTAARARQLA
jgi:hypothetical protein